MPSTQSRLMASLICTLVVLRFNTRVERYSNRVVKLLLNVTSSPNKGEKASLMLTAETLYMLLGTGIPVVALVTNPKPFINSWKVL